MENYTKQQIPEYYHAMFLDGYTPEEIWTAHHKRMMQWLKEMQEEKEAIERINIKSEIKIK